MDENKPSVPVGMMLLAYLWALPITGLAVVIGITVVGIPISLVLLFVACFPLAYLIQKHINATETWKHRDHALDNDTPKPWEE